MPRNNGLPPGTLVMLILRVLKNQSLHGYAIAQRIRQLSTEELSVEEGSLYPALQRLLLQAWIVGEWGKTEENRRARYYKITSAGRKQLERELSRYLRVSGAIARILQPV